VSAVLGLGTYRVRAVEAAARTAFREGATWVDTAPNYCHGQAHGELRGALIEYPKVHVSTKTGFHSGPQRRAALSAGLLTEAEAAAGHTLKPRFIRWQTRQSLALLGRADLVFVHNPEHHQADRAHIHAALLGAFEVLEEFAADGRIGGYGVATWSGFSSGAYTVADLLSLAQQAAGSPLHHLTGVQLPVSLVQLDPLTAALRNEGPLAAAHANGLATFASAPLHGGELPELMTPELVDFIRPGLTPAEAALLAVGSCPHLDVVLLSASTRAHWRLAAYVLSEPLASDELRRVTDVLAAG
jgi:aryl-alcohol dehydrogenase-like predicted oxidoreductase